LHRVLNGCLDYEESGVATRKGGKKVRRAFQPKIERLDELTLLSPAAPALPDVTLAYDLYSLGAMIGSSTEAVPDATWDEVIGHSRLSDLLLEPALQSTDSEALASGHSQLNRYLCRAWSRAGIAPQSHDDCTQAVYVAMLQNLGRSRFDAMLTDIGQTGIRDVLSRETAEGVDFFRAVDTVKKRAQRQRVHQPLDGAVMSVATTPVDATADYWRASLREAIDHSLNPREAALIRATLQGETPAEIASQWGVAAKTISNEKTRVIQKLREILAGVLGD
jgi:RNA polymerase sigma factor (sigma-70 family)